MEEALIVAGVVIVKGLFYGLLFFVIANFFKILSWLLFWPAFIAFSLLDLVFGFMRFMFAYLIMSKPSLGFMAYSLLRVKWVRFYENFNKDNNKDNNEDYNEYNYEYN